MSQTSFDGTFTLSNFKFPILTLSQDLIVTLYLLVTDCWGAYTTELKEINLEAPMNQPPGFQEA